MNIRCANCGQMALETDGKCWHCDEPLPGREHAARKRVRVRESWARDGGPAAIAVYGGLTVLVVLAALLVMRSLGQKPQLQVRLGNRTPPGWTFLPGGDGRFTVTLPDTWTWFEGAIPAEAEALESLIQGDNRLPMATHPLGAETDDMQILFAAEGQPGDPDSSLFMVVAASDRLNLLTYDEALAFLLKDNSDLGEVRFVDNFDKSHVSIIATTPLDDSSEAAIRCRQQFVLGREVSLLASLCAPAGDYAAYGDHFDEIMASFQHLGT